MSPTPSIIRVTVLSVDYLLFGVVTMLLVYSTNSVNAILEFLTVLDVMFVGSLLFPVRALWTFP